MTIELQAAQHEQTRHTTTNTLFGVVEVRCVAASGVEEPLTEQLRGITHE